ncbi:MAG: YceI family protein [Burkholderiales bacterium]|nr:YceI family protein [Burkholderiales bacterium]
MTRAPFAMFAAGALVAAGWPSAGGAADWKSDPAASRLEFVATFEGSAVPGTFRTFDARLRLDPERPGEGTLDVTVRLASADMGIADVNREIAGVAWFDYAAFPQASFRSSGLRRVTDGRYVAPGALTIKGVSRPLELPFAFAGSPRSAVIEGELSLERGAFGIGTGEWASTGVVGPDVRVRFKVKLIPAE